MLISQEPPTEDDLVTELTLLRDEGLPRLRRLDLPALTSAAGIVSRDETPADHVVIESLLRRAVPRLGGGQYGEAAVALLGLDAGARGLNSKERREIAAQAFERTYETFRKNYEPLLIEQLATQILVLCSEQHTRDSRSDLERRHPVESGMALQWIERFEAYYRLWTPVYALAADLTAYRATLIEPGVPYDRRYNPETPDDPGYSQDEQAEGYARDALYHYAHFEWQLRTFIARYGGLWMLSDADVENAVRDAVHRISWHVNPFNERDQSFLRTVIDETPHQELHAFLPRLAASEVGQITHQEWQDWAATCACTWELGAGAETDYFPIHDNQPGITETCQVHQVIKACSFYCKLLDDEWRKIADWYHLDNEVRNGISAERLYTAWRSIPDGANYRAPERGGLRRPGGQAGFPGRDAAVR